MKSWFQVNWIQNLTCMELVVTKVERGVDGFERLEVDINLEEKGMRFYVKIGQTKGMMRLNTEVMVVVTFFSFPSSVTMVPQ